MPPVLVVAFKDLRQRLRDRSALILGFVAPIAIAALMSLAFGSLAKFHTDVGYVDEDHGPVAAAFTQTLQDPAVRSVLITHAYATPEQARSAVAAGTVKAAIIVPAGLSTATTTGAPVTIQVVGTGDNALSAQVAQAVTTSFTSQVNADRLAVRTALATGSVPADLPALAARAATLHLPEAAAQQDLADRPLKAISYYAPGMGIFFAMFALSFGARGYLAEAEAGTLDRIAVAPVRRGTLLAGKLVATFVYVLASLTTMVVVSSLAFGAGWGNPLAVALLCLGAAIAIVCLTALVTTLGRTQRQVDGVASIVVFTLALLGGNFVTAAAMPSVLRRLALFTFNGWALRGFSDLAVGNQGLGAVVGPMLGIGAFCLVVIAVTVPLLRFRRLT